MDLQFFENLQSRNKLIHKDKEGEDILQKLNNLIHGDKWTQRFAICILNSVLKNCDHEVFEENATAWMRFVLQLINTIPSENLLNLCFVSLIQLLEYASNIDKVARDIATKGMDPLLSLLVGTSVPTSSEKINMIKCCIINFPGPCGQHRSAILKLVVSAIESDDYLVCSAACKMFTLLAICGTGGEKKNRFVDNWVNQFYQVVNTTHFYISKLSNKVSGVINDTSVNMVDNSMLITFSEITEGLEIGTAKISVRIERLLLMLQHVIGTAMSFEVPFPILKLIDLFCEVSNLLHVELKGIEGFELILIKITEALLKCISVTMNQFKTMIIPFSQQISKILISAISLSCFANRTSVYQCIINMIDHWKTLTLNIIDNILVSIFNDIKIHDKSDNFSHLEGNCTRNKKDNNTHTLTHDINEQSKKEINRFNYIECQNAYAALKVLEKVLIFNGPVLSADNINSIITNILNVFVKLYAKEGFVSPYSCGDNRLMTFKIAKCLLTLYHGSVQIPVSILLSYFNAGTTELQDGIRCYCNDVLLQYDCIIHPMNPGFYDNTCVQHDLNANYSEAPLSHEKLFVKDIKIKQEEMFYPSFTEDIAPSVNNNNLTSIQSTQQSMRLCSSADQVLVKEATSSVIPTRSSSEPVISQINVLTTMIRHSNNSSTNILKPMMLYNDNFPPIINDCNESETSENFHDEDNTKLEEEEYDDGPVIISDSSEEETTQYIPISHKYQPAPRNGSIIMDVPQHDHLENMYSPRIKKTKLNNGANAGYQDGDPEYIAILDTFCETDADD